MPAGFHKGAFIDRDILIRTGPEAIDPAEAIAFVSRADAGGTALFLGTVRSPNEGEDVDHLDYEAWDDAAGRALRTIADGARVRFGALRVFVVHRTGRVEVGEPSVIVAASAPHRAEAFDACRFVIDALKADAPIWKKEVTASGERWVGMPR